MTFLLSLRRKFVANVVVAVILFAIISLLLLIGSISRNSMFRVIYQIIIMNMAIMWCNV